MSALWNVNRQGQRGPARRVVSLDTRHSHRSWKSYQMLASASAGPRQAANVLPIQPGLT